MIISPKVHTYCGILLVFALLLAACGNEAESSSGADDNQSDTTGATDDDNKRVISHELGETPITGTPERIVTLEFSFVDTLAALGITPVGIADDDDPNRIIPAIQSEIGDWTSVGTRKQPNLEVIASLEPDLIIADLQRHKEIYDDLSKIGPTIVLDSLGASYDKIVTSAGTIGEAVNESEAVEARVVEHQKTMEALKEEIPGEESRKILAGVAAEDSFTLHTEQAFAPDVLTDLGLPYVETDAEGESYVRTSLEQLVQLEPDVLFLIVYSDRTIVDEWKTSDLWQNLPAVKNGEVYEVDRELWSRSRGLVSAEKIAEDANGLLYGEQ